MKNQFTTFIFRWILNSFGLWIAVKVFGTGLSEEQLTAGAGAFLLAGLIFSLANAILRPIVIIMSLPAILMTLGLFTVIVNGFMVYISLQLSPGLSMTFVNSIYTGLLLSLINYIVSSTIEVSNGRLREEKK